MKKKISILGSTGSVGLTTLKIIDQKKLFFSINLLSANKNFKIICKQINKYKPKIFVVTDEKIFKKVYFKFRKKILKFIIILKTLNLLKKMILRFQLYLV